MSPKKQPVTRDGRCCTLWLGGWVLRQRLQCYSLTGGPYTDTVHISKTWDTHWWFWRRQPCPLCYPYLFVLVWGIRILWKTTAAPTELLTRIVHHPPWIIHLVGSFPGNGWRENHVLIPFFSGYEASSSARVERSCIPWVLSCISIHKFELQL